MLEIAKILLCTVISALLAGCASPSRVERTGNLSIDPLVALVIQTSWSDLAQVADDMTCYELVVRQESVGYRVSYLTPFWEPSGIDEHVPEPCKYDVSYEFDALGRLLDRTWQR